MKVFVVDLRSETFLEALVKNVTDDRVAKFVAEILQDNNQHQITVCRYRPH